MNIANRIELQAKSNPNKIALRFPKKFYDDTYVYSELTFRELNELSSHFAHSFYELGIKKGSKVVLFVRPSLDFAPLVFSLFKIGAVPVFIDPGMGRKNLLNSIAQVKPDALIAESEVHILKYFFKKYFKSIKISISTGFSFSKATHTIKDIKKKHRAQFVTQACENDDSAAILFTSGGTGIPKGVVYTHKIFNTQTDILQKIFNLTSEDIDLPGFPLFSFFTMSMGMTSCIPDMNPSKPAKCNPVALVQNIVDNSATFVAGSPAIWERVANYCIENNIILPSVKYLVMFGAPVSIKLHQKFKRILTNGTTYTPYGATESLPISNISGQYILENTSKKSQIGQGTCVGRKVEDIEVKIIKSTEEIISTINEADILETNMVGEIIVRGDVVTKEYYDMEKKTIESKIQDGDTFWHRMGDMGYIDEDGFIWFMGRKAHQLILDQETKYSIPVEAIFNNHLLVRRSALIALKRKNKEIVPAIVIEPNQKYYHGHQLKKELLSLAKKFEHTKNIEDIFFLENFPVDVRHNIKIDRKKIGEMASKGLLK